MTQIALGLIDQVSKGVSQSTIDEISAFHENIRSLLEQRYDTSLQGSYANDTAISDINDVDILAIEKPISNYLPSIGVTNSHFVEIKSILETNQNYRGMITVGHKCLTLSLATKSADIVPAVKLFLGNTNQFGEPFIIAQGINNYPKTHLAYGQAKNQRTNNNYKKIVRMLKNYVNNWNIKEIAPSFYIESLVYSYSDNSFSNDLPLTLANILNHMVGSSFDYNFSTVAGDKHVISHTEWSPLSFHTFKQHINLKLPYLNSATTTSSESMANSHFRSFFNI